MVKVTSQTTYGHESLLRLLRKCAETKLGGHPLSFNSMTLNSRFASEMHQGPSPSTVFDFNRTLKDTHTYKEKAVRGNDFHFIGIVYLDYDFGLASR